MYGRSVLALAEVLEVWEKGEWRNTMIPYRLTYFTLFHFFFFADNDLRISTRVLTQMIAVLHFTYMAFLL